MNMLAAAGDDQLKFDAALLGKRDHGPVAIRAQKCFLLADDAVQHRADGRLGTVFQHPVNPIAIAVNGDQDRHLFRRQACLFSLAATPSRLALELPLPLLAFQEKKVRPLPLYL